MNYAIIAAGEGSRLVSEGLSTPKPLIKLNGEPMIDRLIRIFLKNRAETISIIVNEEMTEVYQHLKGLNLPIPLHLVRKSTPSSMHSFAELASTINTGKFCLTTVDTIFREDEFSHYITAFENITSDGLMAVTDYIDDEKPLYVNVDNDLRITDYKDQAYENARFISGGIYCLSDKSRTTLNYCMHNNVSRMRNFQRQLIVDKLHLEAWPFKKIIDVDHTEDIEKALQFLNEEF